MLPLADVCRLTLCCVLCVQAKEALKHPYFDDMDKVAVDALENPELEAFAEY